MLRNKFDIIVNEKLTLEEFSNILEDFSNGKKLVFGIAPPLDFYINDFHDYDVDLFISQIKQNYFEKFNLSKRDIKRLKKETSMNLDFSEDLFYIPKTLDDIRKFMKIDTFSFVAILIEEDFITHVFYYTEGIDDMIIIGDAEENSDFENVLFDYLNKNKKGMENIMKIT